MPKQRWTVIGFGGYALDHLKAVDWLDGQNLAELTGVIALPQDQRQNPALVAKLTSRDIPLYPSIQAFFDQGCPNTDVLTVPIGIHQHRPVTCQALERGLHVYCEKPAAGTVQEVDAMLESEKRSGKKLAIGFQFLYSHAIEQIKDRLSHGRLGNVRSISLSCNWPRSERYYTRNAWAGKLRQDDDWILDTPANNATSHFLMNLLYLASAEPGHAATPSNMTAELYRANQIESADLTQMRFETDTKTRCFVTFAHCSDHRTGPFLHLEAEKGRVKWEGDAGQTMIEYDSGAQESFNSMTHDFWRYDIFLDFAQAIAQDGTPLCTAKVARAQTLCINAMHESCPQIHTVPEEFVHYVTDIEDYPPRGEERFRRIVGLDSLLLKCFETRSFLSELQVPWGKAARNPKFSLQNYTSFPVSAPIE